MGSASREALARVIALIGGVNSTHAGRELLEAAAKIDASSPLLSAVTDESAPASAKAVLVERLFSGNSSDARRLLSAAVSERWSQSSELIDGIEELAIRVEATVNSALADELLAAVAVIDSNHELELALGSKLSEPAAKAALAKQLFTNKLSDSALNVVSYLAAHPRGRRLGVALRASAVIAADQGGSALATVTVAASLSESQQKQLAGLLKQIADRPVRVTTIIDPSLIGGVRVQLGDQVIDGSVRSRLEDLRLQLAG